MKIKISTIIKTILICIVIAFLLIRSEINRIDSEELSDFINSQRNDYYISLDYNDEVKVEILDERIRARFHFLLTHSEEGPWKEKRFYDKYVQIYICDNDVYLGSCSFFYDTDNEYVIIMLTIGRSTRWSKIKDDNNDMRLLSDYFYQNLEKSL